MEYENLISWSEFQKVQLRVGTIIKAMYFDEARKPAYILHINLGPELGVKKSSAQLTHLYSPSDLVGKLVVCVTNFRPKQIGPIMSEVLVTGFPDAQGNVVLCTTDKGVPNGARLC
jgi:tRNA-binding protein